MVINRLPNRQVFQLYGISDLHFHDFHRYVPEGPYFIRFGGGGGEVLNHFYFATCVHVNSLFFRSATALR